MYTLSFRRVTTTDNATAPAMVPSTMPINAPLLTPDFEEVEIPVTLVKIISIKIQNYPTVFISYIYMKESKLCLTHSSSIAWAEEISDIRCELEVAFSANIEHNLIAQKNKNPLELRIAVIHLCAGSHECNCICYTTKNSITMVKALKLPRSNLSSTWLEATKKVIST